MDLTGKKVLIVGLGASGVAAARLCLAHGAQVLATDKNSDPPAARGLEDQGVVMRLGCHNIADFRGADLVVLSPGVDHRLPEVQAAAEAGAEVIGEMELAFRFLQTPSVMITGTNGKSTVTTLIGEMLKAAGNKVFLGGNLGRPLAEYVLGDQDADWAVLEVSSFQTDTASTLRPRVGVILNITADHLDRYANFDEYAASKFSMLANQRDGDVAVLCADDPEVARRMDQAPAKVLPYGAEYASTPGGRISGNRLVLDLLNGSTFVLDPAHSALTGHFNLLNMLAAGLAASACGVPAQAVQRAIDTMQPLGHRLALVAEIDGVAYYDDSKGTNVGAVQAAIEALDRTAVLLLGGRDKDGAFAELQPQLQKVRGVVCFGEAGPSIAEQINGIAVCRTAADLPGAVTMARDMALPGDAIVLSPGCASFDAYSGYAARGDHFRKIVLEGADG